MGELVHPHRVCFDPILEEVLDVLPRCRRCQGSGASVRSYSQNQVIQENTVSDVHQIELEGDRRTYKVEGFHELLLRDG